MTDAAARPLEPTYAGLIDEIVAVHGAGDPKFTSFMIGRYEGRADRAFPPFWQALCSRAPSAQTVREVVSAWSKDEIASLYGRFLNYPNYPQASGFPVDVPAGRTQAGRG